MELFVFAFLIGAVVTPIVAASKGRNWFGWLLLGLLLPVIALLLVALLPSLKEQTVRVEGLAAPAGPADAPPGQGVAQSATAGDAQQRRACPHCAEQILMAAVKCRFCGETVEPVKPISAPSKTAAPTVAWVNPDVKTEKPTMSTTPCYRCTKPVPAIAADCPYCGAFIRSKKQAAANANSQ